MANFVAYSTRIGGRDVGTLHVVGAYAAGGYSVIHNREGTGHTYLETVATDGRHGWSSPDNVSYDQNFNTFTAYQSNPAFVGFDYGVYELVGVQVYGIFTRSVDGSTSKISGEALGNYVEKTEHRYLANGHVTIKVYFNEEAMKGFFGSRDQIIVGASALLQTGSHLGTQTFAKKRVPFMLSMPSVADGTEETVQNPTINVEEFLYSPATNNIPETGFKVQVENMGTNVVGMEWNTVRTATNFEGPSDGVATGQGLSSTLDNESGNMSFYPHFGVFNLDPGSAKADILGRHADVARSQNDCYAPGHTNFGSITTHTGSGTSFDIREMTAHTDLSFGSKQAWGRHTGHFQCGYEEDQPQHYGGYSGAFPPHWGGDSLKDNAPLAALGFGESFTGPKGPKHDDFYTNSEISGNIYHANFDTAGNRRNPFYPVYGSSYGHYVSFFKWEGFNTSLVEGAYVPTNITTQGVTDANRWPYYIAETFRLAFVGGMANGGAPYFEPSGVTQNMNLMNAHDFLGSLTSSNAVGLVYSNKMSWQDYIGTCMNLSSQPFSAVGTNITSGFSVLGTDSGRPFLTSTGIQFSGLAQTRALANQNQLALTQGLDMTIPGDAEYDSDLITYQAANTNIAGDGSRLYKYTVYVYSDQPVPRLNYTSEDPLLGPGVNSSVDFTITNDTGTYTQEPVFGEGAKLGLQVLENTRNSGIRLAGIPRYNWLDGGIVTNKCVDRNSDASFTYYDDDATTFFLANCNVCSEASYSRCGCENIVEEFGEGELVNISSLDPGDSRRFETVVVCPRPITTHFQDIFSGGAGSAFPSIYYINSYYNAVDNTTTINATFASSYLTNGSTSLSNIDFITSGNATGTNTLSSLGLSDYDGLLWNDVFDELSTDTNTFTYLYMPGREPFESEDGVAYFVHDDAAFARTFATITGTGSSDADATNDREHRQMLLFQASDATTAATDPKRAHSDMIFSHELWADTGVEASYISHGVPTACEDGADKPVRRIRKFVVVTTTNRDEGIGDDGEGGGNENVYGCTNEDALNYNPAANADDGSCVECDSTLTDNTADQEALPDPFHLIPLLYDGYGHNFNLNFMGSASNATTVGNEPNVGSTGTFTYEVGIPAGEHPSETYSWWDGNVVNAFNTRGVADNGLGALNSGNEPLSDVVGNTARSFFRLQVPVNAAPTPASGTGMSQASHASIIQYGNSEHAAEILSLWGSIQNNESTQQTSLAIFEYTDWETNVAPNIPNKELGNNGWAVDSWSGTYTGTNQARPNVYHDETGDFTGIHLNGVTPVAILQNNAASANPFELEFGNYSYNGGPISVTDIGLEAGNHYVAVVRFRPKNSCGEANNAYYWAYNFWVKYCTCTDPLSLNFGEANPTSLDTYPFHGQYHEAFSAFPGVNTPNSTVNITTGSGGINNLPTDFCTGFTEDFSDSEGGNAGSRLCIVDQDTEVSCADFASWCLSDITNRCETDELDGLSQYGVLSFNVLIDGFFGQSELDSYQLFFNPDPQNANPALQFYYKVEVFLAGNATSELEVYSHNFNASTGYWEPNAQVIIQSSGSPDNYGEYAMISIPEITWDQDLDSDDVIDPLTVEVHLTYLGIVNTGVPGDGTYDSTYPDYVTDAPCPTYILTHTADFSECTDLIPGCLDPLANNFNPNATIEDGSCQYIGCDEIWSQSRNSVFITDITTTRDRLLCADVLVDASDPTGPTYNQYTPQFEGTMKITIDDFSVAQLGASGLEGNFTIGVIHLDGGSLNTVGGMLEAYELNIDSIQALVHPTFISVGSLNGVFFPPDLDNAGNGTVTSVIDGQTLTGQRYVTDVPVGAINGGSLGLSAGQYLVFLVPYINYDVLEAEGFGGLSDCEEEFAFFTDEQTFAVVENVVEDDDCTQPCDQFVNPDDCPDAVPGCTDETADNYNPDATFNDGSCEYCQDCEFCDRYPAHPSCDECDKGEQPSLSANNRGFGARLRNCEGDNTKCCCDETACNYDAACVGDCDPDICEHGNCVDDEIDCDPQIEECEDEPICPDPTNPECDNSSTGNCIDGDQDCECVTTDCNEDCVFEENNCEDDDDGETEIIDEFSTTTIICEPSISIPVTIDGVQESNFVQAAVACTSKDSSKFLMRMKSGQEYDNTDLLKLSLITYLFNRGTEQQLDCLFDCDNYQSRVKSDGKVKGIGQRLVPKDCEESWRASGKKIFAASSSYLKGTVVKYVRMVSGKMTAGYFVNKRDYTPGEALPDQVKKRGDRLWDPCVNIKYQAGTNPENYMNTFIEFMVRHCQSCEITTTVTVPDETSKFLSNNTSIGFQDEFGNDLIF